MEKVGVGMIYEKTKCEACGHVWVQRGIKKPKSCPKCRKATSEQSIRRRIYSKLELVETESVVPWPPDREGKRDHAECYRLTNAIKTFFKRKGWLFYMYFMGDGIHVRRRVERTGPLPEIYNMWMTNKNEV